MGKYLYICVLLLEFIGLSLLIYYLVKKYSRKIRQKQLSSIFLADIDYMDGHQFEYWCADLLRQAGFKNVYVTQGSNDQGVDIIAYRNNQKYAIQCKRYSKPLGNRPVQEVVSGRSVYGCDRAAVMTNNYFTHGAKLAAAANNVNLWDRDKIERILLVLNERQQEGR